MTVPPLDPARAQLTSKYGWRTLDGKQDLHTGIDLAAAEGTEVRAIAPGRVLVSEPPGKLGGYGNVVVVEHVSTVAPPLYTLYAHMNARTVAAGDLVQEGQTIGFVGDTGGQRGVTDHHIGFAHLHFEVLKKWPPAGKDEDRVDPTRLWPPAMSAAKTKPQTATKVATQPTAAAGSTTDALFVALMLWAGWRWYQNKSRREA